MHHRFIAVLSFLLLALLSVPVPAFGSISVAVKRGQTEVDPKTLPFASFTITMETGALPLQKIVLIDVATGKEIAVGLESSFSSKIEYLTAMEGKRRMHAQIIVALKPGHYEFKRIEFNPSHAGQLSEFAMDVSRIGHFRFEVLPKAVNYCGSLVFSTDWGSVWRMRAAPGESVNESFQVSVAVEQTQQRDFSWAADVIPAMRKLPSVVSPIVKQ